MLRRMVMAIWVFGVLPSGFSFEEELRFSAALAEEGFAGLAQTVLSRTLRKFPQAEESSAELRIRILIAGKKFDEARAEITAAGGLAPLWLCLAETAVRFRNQPIAEAAYRSYFESGPESGDEMVQAAFYYGGLLEERGDRKAARTLYEQVLRAADCENRSRPIRIRLAEILISPDTPEPQDLDRAKKLSEEVLLGGLDLWFGQAVVIWSRIMCMREEWGEALPTLETQLEALKQTEEALDKQGPAVSALSPLAGARFMLGVCYEHMDRKPEALHQFYNVYASYGDSAWGPKAKARSEELIRQFREQGRTVKIDPGSKRARLEENTFRMARRLFADQRYAEAVPALMEPLNAAPEGSESVAALRELLFCFITLRDGLCAKTVAAYTAERFSEHDAAAEALSAAGNHALEEKSWKLAEWLYELCAATFPRHPRVSDVLGSLASLDRQEGDSAGEEKWLVRITELFPDSPHAVRAFSRLAWNAFEKEDYTAATERFEQIAEMETDLEKQMKIRFALAEACRLSGDRNKALERFQALEEFLNAVAEGFGVPDEQLAASGPFREKSLFYQGDCLIKLGRPAEAVSLLERFTDLFPASEIFPQAQFAKGSALMALRRYDDALTAFSYFNEASGRQFLEPVLCARGEALFETGRYRESIASLEPLVACRTESPLFFEAGLALGRAHAAAGEPQAAVRVLSDVLNAAATELQVHRAGLALGRAQTEAAEKLASFQRVALLADPSDPEQAELIGQALFESLPLQLELHRPQDLLSDSERLLEEFQNFGRKEEIEAMRRAVRQEMANVHGKERSNVQ